MSIRTTITLDDDVVDRAKRFSSTRGISFREGLNELVRMGLIADTKPVPAFELKPRRMGLRPGLSYDNIEELIEFAEGPLHR